MRNTLLGIGGQLLSQLMAFAYRTVFIHYLSASFLGVQGLFSNILSLLSLAELGVGNALTFSLYMPLAQKDTNKVRSLIGYYARAYRMIAIVVAVIGVSLTPFLDYFIKEIPSELKHLQIIYLLYLFDAAASYCLVYKQSIIKADQKTYICTFYSNLISIVRYIVQIVVLVFFSYGEEWTFIGILSIQIFFTIVINGFLSAKASKLYPYIKGSRSERLPVGEKQEINKKVRVVSTVEYYLD